MKIAYVYTDGRRRRLERVGRRNAASDFLYGSEELRPRGHEVKLVELAGAPVRRMHRWFWDHLAQTGLLPHKVDGELIERVHAVLPQLAGSEVVVAAGSPTAFAVTIWQLLGRLSMPVVGIHCGLFNYDFVRLQKRVTRALLQRSWAVLFGHAEYDPMCYLSDAPERIRVVECGTDVEFWSPGPATQGDYVFAIGNDGRRDFDGLLRAATGLDIPVKLVTSISPGVPIPANVEIVRGDLRKELLSDEQIRELYRNAKCVVVPLKETLQPSGQSVCLQAMACGRPVIMSDISGVWSRSRLRDGENIRLVPVGDDVALRGAIVELWNDQGLADRIAKCGLDTVRDVWNMQDYATGILRACEQAVRESRISQ